MSEGDPFSRFRKSMEMDFDKWHDGIGYDLDAWDEMSPHDQERMESIIIASSPWNWRDIEIMAHIGTPNCMEGLREASHSNDRSVRLAVLRYAPETVTKEEHIAIIIEALEKADIYHGLSQALDLVEESPMKELEDALIRGIMIREGDVAYHFASMLLYLHGRIDSPYDMGMRGFLLRFNTEDLAERHAAFDELMQLIGQ